LNHHAPKQSRDGFCNANAPSLENAIKPALLKGMRG